MAAGLQAVAAPPRAAPGSLSTSLRAALGQGAAAGDAGYAAIAGPSHGRSSLRPEPAAGDNTGALAGAFDLVNRPRNDASPHALRPADPDAFGALVAAFSDAIAGSGADSTNQ